MDEIAPVTAPVDDLQPVVGSPADLALPAYGQQCDSCPATDHQTCFDK